MDMLLNSLSLDVELYLNGINIAIAYLKLMFLFNELSRKMGQLSWRRAEQLKIY
jgi:hypothetical protein